MRNAKYFFGSFFLTCSIVFCVFAGAFGAAKAYENTVFTAFGAEKSAIAFTDDGLRIFDFEIKL